MDDLEGYVEMIGVRRKADDNDNLAKPPIKSKKTNSSVKKGSAGRTQKKERRGTKDKTENKQHVSKVQRKSSSYCQVHCRFLEGIIYFITGGKKMGEIITITDHSKEDQRNGKFLHSLI